jgi:hypothetical protein
MNAVVSKRGMHVLLTAAAWLFCSVIPAQAQQPLSAGTASLSLAPSVVIHHGKFGQSFTESITLTNGTEQTLEFEMSAQDVIVKNGKRVFVAPGEAAHSIASSAVFSLRSGSVGPRADKTVQVILTLPAETNIRAVVVTFRSKRVATQGSVSLNASLGSLITFVLSDAIAVQAEPIRVQPQTASTDLTVIETLSNTGSEPVVPTGVAAFVDATGALAAKVPFQAQRLLPAEALRFTAEYSGHLKPGVYRVLCSFQFEGKTVTSTGEYRAL